MKRATQGNASSTQENKLKDFFLEQLKAIRVDGKSLPAHEVKRLEAYYTFSTLLENRKVKIDSSKGLWLQEAFTASWLDTGDIPSTVSRAAYLVICTYHAFQKGGKKTDDETYKLLCQLSDRYMQNSTVVPEFEMALLELMALSNLPCLQIYFGRSAADAHVMAMTSGLCLASEYPHLGALVAFKGKNPAALGMKGRVDAFKTLYDLTKESLNLEQKYMILYHGKVGNSEKPWIVDAVNVQNIKQAEVEMLFNAWCDLAARTNWEKEFDAVKTNIIKACPESIHYSCLNKGVGDMKVATPSGQQGRRSSHMGSCSPVSVAGGGAMFAAQMYHGSARATATTPLMQSINDDQEPKAGCCTIL